MGVRIFPILGGKIIKPPERVKFYSSFRGTMELNAYPL